jgi:hypothetical protein
MLVYVVYVYNFVQNYINMSLLRELEIEETVIQQQLQQLHARLEAIQLLKGQITISPTPAAAKAVYLQEKFPTQYSPDLTQIQKIYVCILTLKSCNVHDIAAQLKRFDPKEFKDKEFTAKAAANGVFKLNKTGVLNASKQGRSVYYSIK